MTCRPAYLFRQDLNSLYSQGYRPISLTEYLNNKIDLPAGKKPVILSFDDALTTQFRYLSDHRIDPNCALGILLAFHEKHPDWALKGVFFVLPTQGFGPKRERSEKVRTLLKLGFEAENHTLNHYYFNRISDSEIIRQIALGQAGIEKLAPKDHIDILALPGGCLPRSHHYGIMTSGEYDGIHYHNRAIIMAADSPAPAPADKKFNPLRVPRIVAYSGEDGVTAWINWLKRHPSQVYVSDGDPKTVTVPATDLHLIDRKKLQGDSLIVYGSIPKTAKNHSHSLKKRSHSL